MYLIRFDLGCRKDYWNHPPAISQRLGDVIPGLRVSKNTSEILEEQGIPLNSITSVVWSHYHWDHTGNVSLFPPTTSLIVGPDFHSKLPGYPTNTKSPINESDFAGRELISLAFDTDLHIGRFSAHDLFGDGSFYLLDSPGHCVGHICGLARVTPTSFVFMGGDICHFSGDFRPSASYPLPDPIPQGYLDEASFFPKPCPCSLFTKRHPRVSGSASEDEKRSTPFYEVTDHPKSAYIDPPVAAESVRKMQEFDDSPDVLVCIAHDPVLLEVLPTLNQDPGKDLNVWKEQGWKETCHWGWLNELPRNGKPGRKILVEGLQGKPGSDDMTTSKL
jgi:glyoxylase-like metal-dependent hydrolase (beta-lactamase superfamily II)